MKFSLIIFFYPEFRVNFRVSRWIHRDSPWFTVKYNEKNMKFSWKFPEKSWNILNINFLIFSLKSWILAKKMLMGIHPESPGITLNSVKFHEFFTLEFTLIHRDSPWIRGESPWIQGTFNGTEHHSKTKLKIRIIKLIN